MPSPEGLEPPADDGLRSFQFGLYSLLLLTSLVAGALALLRPLNLPPSLYGAWAAYAIALAIYVAFRGVHL